MATEALFRAYEDSFFMKNAPGTKVNPFQPDTSAARIDKPFVMERKSITPMNAFVLGEGELKFRVLKQHDYLGEMDLEILLPTLPATPGEQEGDPATPNYYIPYVGLYFSTLWDMKVNDKAQWNWKDAMLQVHSWLHDLPADVKAKILEEAGGATPTGGIVKCPIIYPGSRFWNGFSQHVPQWPMLYMEDDMFITFETMTPANLIANGSTGTVVLTTQPKLNFQHYKVTPEQRKEDIKHKDKWFMKTVMVDIHKHPTVIASSTTKDTHTEIDIRHLKNEYKDFVVLLKSATNITQRNYLDLVQIDRKIGLYLNKEPLYVIGDGSKDETKNIDYDMLINSTEHMTDANLFKFRFDQRTTTDESNQMYFGGAVPKPFDSVDIHVQQGSGGNCWAYVIAKKHVILKAMNGTIEPIGVSTV